MKKRGQFYIIAAFVIIGLVVGIVTVSNYSKKSENIKIHSIKEELGIESEQVLEYGVYDSSQSTDTILDKFSKDISEYISDDSKNIYFVYGNKNSDLNFIALTTVDTGSISLGSSTNNPTQDRKFSSGNIPIENNNPNVQINIEGTEYNFSLQEGENFYFIITEKTSTGEEFSVTNAQQ